MAPSEHPNRFSLTLPGAGFVLGLLVGLVDWLILATDWGSSQSGMWYLPRFAWLTVIWTSITICVVAGILLSWPRLGRLRGPLLAGIGLSFILIRSSRPLRETCGFSTAGLLAFWLVILLLVAIPLGRMRIVPVRRWAAWNTAAAVSVVLLTTLAVGPDLQLRSSGAAARANGSKNVVLIFLDTMRYDDVFGGTDSAMPGLETFGRRSTVFDNAWAAEPWTIPSHFSVLRGVDPWTAPHDARGFHSAVPSLAERFAAHGYDTAAILSNPLLGNPDFSRGFRHFTYSRASGVCRSAAGELLNRLWVHGAPRSPLCGWLIASEISDRARAFLRRSTEPYFLVLNYMDAHYPYYVPLDCREPELEIMSRADRDSFRHAGQHPVGEAVLAKARSQHRASARCIDRSLAPLLMQLEKDPRMIVVVVGDHGEQFGEHGLFEHGNSLYRQLLHVPLVVHSADSPGRVTAAVSTTDVYSSLLVLAGVASAGARSPLSDEHLRRPAISSFDAEIGGKATGAFSAASGNAHFILWRDGRESLFDDAADPTERFPLPIKSSPGAGVAGPLRALTSEAMAASGKSGLEFRALNYLR